VKACPDGRSGRWGRLIAPAFGSALFFAAAPTVVAGVVPWLLTDWRAGASWASGTATLATGALLVGAGVVVLVQAFVRFVVEGSGTPAPVAPTAQLVVGGLYRYVRNPMYVAVIAIITGQAFMFGRTGLLVYGATVGTVMVSFVKLYEEPVLAQRFGDEYVQYKIRVPGWVPRRRAWHPCDEGQDC
jgi:protein-S-isoprenylcysteine O-methyltransferase Ste14